jgi:UDP-N-acetylmuramoyl-L-alanyl-D-glutamate--2,6-diaminopimelate ligase
LKLLSAERDGFAQRLTVQHTGGTESFRLPLVGAFQASNALVAAGLCMATGADAAEVLPLVTNLRGARGRLELAATTRTGAPIFIDYAHTPDALAKALDALRPYVHNRLTVVFGCGGDRDKGKRPQMGAVAVDKADIAIVTDDNPRSEEPSEIRREILAAAPGAIEVPGRAAAVAEAVADLKQGDVLLIAGKGHETGQIVKGAIFPYSDHDAVDVALKGGAKRA